MNVISGKFNCFILAHINYSAKFNCNGSEDGVNEPRKSFAKGGEPALLGQTTLKFANKLQHKNLCLKAIDSSKLTKR